jgi:hypothetical protein
MSQPRYDGFDDRQSPLTRSQNLSRFRSQEKRDAVLEINFSQRRKLLRISLNFEGAACAR